MSYSGNDRSVQNGQPVEFYKFYGGFGEYRFTSNDEPAMCNGEIYHPVPGGVSRSSIRVTSDLGSVVTTDFSLPADNPLAILYCFRRSPDQMTVEVRRAHRGDNWATDFSLEWVGYAMDSSVSGNYATIRTGSVIQGKFGDTIANKYYQRTCNHSLFDERCGINKAAWTFTTTVTKINGQELTVTDDFAANGELSLGNVYLPRTGEYRQIISNHNNVISVVYVFTQIEIGDTVELTYGCDHSRLGHCKNRFNNVDRYGGYDFIPRTNILYEVEENVTTTTKGGQTYPRNFAGYIRLIGDIFSGALD